MYIIAIEGNDGCGKHTQASILYSKIKERIGDKAKFLSFPRYQNDSTILIKKYLKGELGEDPNKINPYVSGMMFAMDRAMNFIENTYDDDDIIICDRYMFSNFIHQLSKFNSFSKKYNYMSSMIEQEKRLGVPLPNLNIILEMKAELSEELLDNRYGDDHPKDIHETDSFMRQSREAINFLKYGDVIDALDSIGIKNKFVNCDDGKSIRTIDDISEEIYQIVKNNISSLS